MGGRRRADHREPDQPRGEPRGPPRADLGHPFGTVQHFLAISEEEREALIEANSDVSRFEDAGLGVNTGRQYRVETLFHLRERLSRKTVPAGGAFGDVARALFGAKEVGGTTPPKTDDLLKIARFVLDGHRDLPGVDK